MIKWNMWHMGDHKYICLVPEDSQHFDKDGIESELAAVLARKPVRVKKCFRLVAWNWTSVRLIHPVHKEVRAVKGPLNPSFPYFHLQPVVFPSAAKAQGGRGGF